MRGPVDREDQVNCDGGTAPIQKNIFIKFCQITLYFLSLFPYGRLSFSLRGPWLGCIGAAYCGHFFSVVVLELFSRKKKKNIKASPHQWVAWPGRMEQRPREKRGVGTNLEMDTPRQALSEQLLVLHPSVPVANPLRLQHLHRLHVNKWIDRWMGGGMGG